MRRTHSPEGEFASAISNARFQFGNTPPSQVRLDKFFFVVFGGSDVFACGEPFQLLLLEVFTIPRGESLCQFVINLVEVRFDIIVAYVSARFVRNGFSADCHLQCAAHRRSPFTSKRISNLYEGAFSFSMITCQSLHQ